MSLYDTNGSIRLTAVDGSTRTGLYAPDGAMYIVLNDGSAWTGRYHSCGAMNAVLANGSTYGQASNGSIYVNSDGSGGYNPNTPLKPRSISLPATNLVSAYGVLPLAGYSGPVAQATKVADSSTKDITNTKAVPGDGTYRFSKLYNQVQAGNDLVNASLSTMMLCDVVGEYGNYRPLIADGTPADPARILRSTGTMPAINRQTMTIYLVANVHKAYEVGSMYEFADAGYTTNYAHLITNSGPCSWDSGVLSSSRYARLGPQVMSVSVSPTSVIVRIGGRETTLAVSTASQLVSALQLGQILFSATYAGSLDYYGMYVYSATHNSATMQSIEATLTDAFGLQSITSFNRTLVYGGSSLISAYRVTKGQQPPWVLGYGKNQGSIANVECFNISGGGQQLGAAYSGRAGTFGVLYDSTKTAWLPVIDAPSNDIVAQTFTSQADAEQWASDFLGVTNTARATNTVFPFVTYLKGLGVNVKPPVLPTIIARGNITTVNFQEYARLKYNQLLIANSGAQGYIVSDRASITQLQNPADTTYFHGDQIHLNDNGSINYLAPCDGAAITAAFAS